MMSPMQFTAEVWRWDARREDWYFLTVPHELSQQIHDYPRPPRGFGSVKVRVTIGSTTWTTSIFPGVHDGDFSLPLKKAVRTAEGFEFGDVVNVELEPLE